MKISNNYFKQNQNGITLIALIITIVILLILTVVAISNVQNEGIIYKAERTAFISKVKKYEEELALYINEKETETLFSFDQTTLVANKTTPIHINEIIKSISKEDEENFIIQAGNLLYVGENQQQKEFCESIGLGVGKNIKKIYGNTQKSGTTIQSVGDLVTDTEDVNYNKYKITIKTTKESGEETNVDIYLNQPLRKTDDVVDILDFSTGILSTQIKEITFDGSSDEAWKLNTALAGVNRFTINISDSFSTNLGDINNQCKSNYFDTTSNLSSANANKSTNFVCVWLKTAYFYTDPEEFPDLATWKNWLALNNVKLQYKTNTVENKQVDLPDIITNSKNNIEISTQVQPSKLEF